jgi:cytochrome c oxidase subunit 2
VYSTVVYFDLIRPPAETLEIYSTGKRGCGGFQHLDGKAEINELHVPKGRAVRVTFTSERRAALAVLPVVPREGRRHSRALQLGVVPTHPDRRVPYLLRGVLRHQALGMIGTVVVMEPDAYQAWLSGNDGQPLAVRGQQLFQQLACVSCHLDDNTGAVRRWPDLRDVRPTGRWRHGDRRRFLSPRVDPDAARENRRGLPALMPTFQGQVNEEGVMGLIEFIKSKAAVARPAPANAQANAAPVRP